MNSASHTPPSRDFITAEIRVVPVISLIRLACRACGLSALLPAVLAAAGIYVAPHGSDANPGTAAQPVATPQAAAALVRSKIAAGLAEPVEVIFETGTYSMSAPLELRPEDSGTAAFPITWQAAPGAKVTLSGGKPVKGPWTKGKGEIWHTDLSGIGLGPDEWNFRQLFVNGKRATRARFPNAGEANPFLYATGGGFDHVIIKPSLIKPGWGAAPDAQINIVPQSRFFNQWNTVTGVNTSTGRIDLADSERHRLIDEGSWFWIEGVREELDEPGEWFLDPSNGRLYYQPEPGVDPNSLEIIAPFLDSLIHLKGDVNTGSHVRHVRFNGLRFYHTNSTIGHIEARVHTDTVILFENTLDCSVSNCHFENIGGYALWLHLDSRRNVFDRNTVRNSGAGGVLLTGSRFAYMDDSKVYTPGEAAAKVAPILNSITRNTVEHCGKLRYYGGGVHLDSRPFPMTMAPGNYIGHNHFNDLSRNGVFAFRNQGGNVVEYNHIHNAMQTTIDGGCIHFATMNTLNAPNFVLNNWLYDTWGYHQKPDGKAIRKLANGVFLDWDTSNTTVKDNWIHNSVGGDVKVIFGGNQNVVKEGNQSSEQPVKPPFADQVGPAGTASHGIDLTSLGRTGSVIHYTDGGHFSLVPADAAAGLWEHQTAVGLQKLFEFNFLAGIAPPAAEANPQKAVYKLPVTADGHYQVYLLYKPGADRATNAPVSIAHADGVADLKWNMRRGSKFGFAVPVGSWRFKAGGNHTVTLGTAGANGKVIADSVAFVKMADKVDAANPSATTVRHPNIVLIMADDLGYGSPGCYGGGNSNTQHIDRLAAVGVRFTDFHGNGPLCSPTRAALLTGRYQQRCVLVPGEDLSPMFREQREQNMPQRWAWGIADQELTIAELLQQAGYRTGIVGKWHLGYDFGFHPMNHGFDEFRGFVGGNVDYYSHIAGYGMKQLDWWNGKTIANEEGYATDLLTRYAVDFIERNKDQPFFLYLAHGTPHNPWQGRDPAGMKSPAETYKEMIAVLDESVGEVMAALRQHGLEQNTLVIFCSDNGAAPPQGVPANGRLRGRKGSLFEGGHRVPCIASWPGVIAAGSIQDAPAMTMDFFPTFAGLARVVPPAGHVIDGIDLMPLLKGGQAPPERILHWLSGDDWAVRKGPWKLTGKDQTVLALVDLDHDIREKRDRRTDLPKRVDELMELHRQWSRSVAGIAILNPKRTNPR